MITHTAATVVLLFSSPNRYDARRKKLADERSGKQAQTRNVALWRTMEQFTRAKVNAAGLSCISSTKILSPSDYESSFGHQLQRAASILLNQGYQRVIIVGNDCPDLRISDLKKAANALANDCMPIGYDKRGGVFLLGLDQRFLTKNLAGLFAELPWQTPKLGICLTDFLADAFGQISCLSSVRSDWNERSDRQVGAWLLGAFAGLAHRIWALVSTVPIPLNFTFAYFSAQQARPYGLRAPPVVA